MVITILRNFKKCWHLKALSTVGVEEILCGVTKLKNLIFAKGREYENMHALPENFEFQTI